MWYRAIPTRYRAVVLTAFHLSLVLQTTLMVSLVPCGLVDKTATIHGPPDGHIVALL